MLRYQTQPAREAALERTRTVASAMDDVVRVPGTNVRFGLDPLLSIVPGTRTTSSMADATVRERSGAASRAG